MSFAFVENIHQSHFYICFQSLIVSTPLWFQSFPLINIFLYISFADPPVSCDGLLEGTYLSDPFECQYYYRCLYNEARRGKCADGLLWSDVYTYCDHDFNVNCNGRALPGSTASITSLQTTATPSAG